MKAQRPEPRRISALALVLFLPAAAAAQAPAQPPPPQAEPVTGIWYTSLDATPLKLGLVKDAASLEPVFFYATCGAQDGVSVARVSIEVGSRVLAESISGNARLTVRLQTDAGVVDAPVDAMSLNAAATRPDAAWTAALTLRSSGLFAALASPNSVLLHILSSGSMQPIVRSFRLPDDNRAAAARAFAQACFTPVLVPEAQAAPPAAVPLRRAIRSKPAVRAKSTPPAKTQRAKPAPRPAKAAPKGAKKPNPRAPLQITPR